MVREGFPGETAWLRARGCGVLARPRRVGKVLLQRELHEPSSVSFPQTNEGSNPPVVEQCTAHTGTGTGERAGGKW